MAKEQKHIYLIVCDVDVGLSVESVYSNFNDIPFKKVPIKKYKWEGDAFPKGKWVEDGYEENLWESEERVYGKAKFLVYRYPLIGDV